jgi:hypothetical protein
MIGKRSKFVAVLILAVVAGGFWAYSNSLLRSDASIRRSLLKHTPLGTSRDDCFTFVEKQGWTAGWGLSESMWQNPNKPKEMVVVSSFGVDLGHYTLVLRTDVEAFWGFDASNRLVDVCVRRSTDAP